MHFEIIYFVKTHTTKSLIKKGQKNVDLKTLKPCQTAIDKTPLFLLHGVRLQKARLTDPTTTRTLRAVRDDLLHLSLVVRIGILLNAQHTETAHTLSMQLHQRMTKGRLMDDVVWVDGRLANGTGRFDVIVEIARRRCACRRCGNHCCSRSGCRLVDRYFLHFAVHDNFV